MVTLKTDLEKQCTGLLASRKYVCKCSTYCSLLNAVVNYVIA